VLCVPPLQRGYRQRHASENVSSPMRADRVDVASSHVYASQDCVAPGALVAASRRLITVVRVLDRSRTGAQRSDTESGLLCKPSRHQVSPTAQDIMRRRAVSAPFHAIECSRPASLPGVLSSVIAARMALRHRERAEPHPTVDRLDLPIAPGMITDPQSPRDAGFSSPVYLRRRSGAQTAPSAQRQLVPDVCRTRQRENDRRLRSGRYPRA
jgi:hypothetical protein